jgi:hypothetical protein
MPSRSVRMWASASGCNHFTGKSGSFDAAVDDALEE